MMLRNVAREPRVKAAHKAMEIGDDSARAAPGHLCKAGYLSQQHRADGRWRSRLWFVCDDGTKLVYFTHRPSSAEIPNCIVRFLDASDVVSDVVTQDPKGGYTFELRVDGTDTYTFKAEAAEEAQEVKPCLLACPLSGFL